MKAIVAHGAIQGRRCLEIRMRKMFMRTLAALICALALAEKSQGGGIEIPMQDGRAAGQADAFTAQADDPSAIFYNPGGLTQIHGTQAQLGALGLFPDWRFHGDNGSSEDMTLPSVTPQLFFATDLGTEKLRAGIGLFNEFGLNEDWGNTGPLRTVVDQGHLMVLNLAPTLAYQVTENLSVGAALNIYYGELSLTRNVVLGPSPTPEGEFHVRGHDWAVGATPGFLWKLDEHNSIAGYYRSPFTLNLQGSAQVSGPVQLGPSHAVTPLNLPQSTGLGYALRPIKNLKVEADVIWTDWDTLSQLTIHSPDPRFNGQTIPSKWESGFTYRLGAEYCLDKNWTIRGGYAYSQDAVPQSTYAPIVPDSNYHLFAVGLGYDTPRWSLDAAYEFIYRERRHIENSAYSPTVNGTWDNTYNGVMLTFTLKL